MSRSMILLRLLALLLGGSAMLTAGPPAGAAPASMTVAGTIASVSGAGLTVTTPSGSTSVLTGPTTRVFRLTPAAFQDIKVGHFIGVTARKEPNGSLTAVEIHIFPPSLRGRIHEGQFRMATGNLMTNATVTQYLSRVSGRTVTLKYQGGTTTIAVPPNTPVRRLTVGSLDQLKAGMHVTVRGTANENGSLTASSITVQGSDH
jgi:hypothetical protein